MCLALCAQLCAAEHDGQLQESLVCAAPRWHDLPCHARVPEPLICSVWHLRKSTAISCWYVCTFQQLWPQVALICRTQRTVDCTAAAQATFQLAVQATGPVTTSPVFATIFQGALNGQQGATIASTSLNNQ